MIGIVQRVTEANVAVDSNVVGEIELGLAVLVAVAADDTQADVDWMAAKLAGLRIFRNGDKHFDLDVVQVSGAMLLVSNFTVAAETRKGRRPSLDGAADPAKGRELFDALVVKLRELGIHVETGRFGASMKVSIVNDGPATFIVDSADARKI